MRCLMAVCILLVVCAVSDRAVAQPQPLLERGDPKVIPKGRPLADYLFWGAQGYLAAGTWFDSSSTVEVLGHPTMAYRENGTFLMKYAVTEGGWARCFGKRNAFAASTANVALNLGIAEASRRLYRRGGRWRFLAIGLVAARATSSTLAGMHNAQVSADINRQVRQFTGYRGVILWRH